jgi:sortase A
VRRQVGLALCASGALALLFVGGRYAVGAESAERAREEWNEASARAAIEKMRASVDGRAFGPVAEGQPIARLVIPRIDLDEIVLEGVREKDLNGGPGHVPGSALPGERGNAIVSAHRDRHFRRFDELAVGDTIRTETRRRADVWVISSRRVIDKNAPALFHTNDATLTLTTCWPIRYLGTAPERLIITAKRVN